MKRKKQPRTKWKEVIAEMTREHQSQINELTQKVENANRALEWAQSQLSDERKFTETFARMLQLVTLIDPIRAQDKNNALHVYGIQNPGFSKNRCCEWKIPERTRPEDME